MGRVRRTWTVENTWTCEFCKTLNKGRDLHCRGCKARKGDKVKDHVPDPATAPEVKDPELLRKAKAGPNWVCEFCGGQERNPEGKCSNCAGARPRQPHLLPDDERPGVPVILANADGAEEIGRVPVPEVEYEHDPTRDPFRDAPKVKPRKEPSGGHLFPTARGMALAEALAKRERRQRWLAYFAWLRLWHVGVALGLAGIVWLFVWLLTPRVVVAEVTDISWHYTVHLRERHTLHDEGWGRPSGKGFYNEPVFNMSCDSRYYGDEDCHPHDCHPHSVSYECNCTSYDCNCQKSCTDNKNGFSSCSETCSTCRSCSTCSRTEYDTCYDRCPVYRDWCAYDYYDWPIIMTKEDGGHDHKVRWPDLRVGDAPTPYNGAQRLQKIEQYRVVFHSDHEAFEYAPSALIQFQRFNIGDVWKLKVGRVRGKIEALEPAKRE